MAWYSTLFGPYGSYSGATPETNGQAPGLGRLPQTHAEWVARKNWLHNAYEGGPYTTGDMKELGLFRARDPNDEVILETRRLVRDVQHVVDVGAMALWGPEPAIDLQPGGKGSAADIAAGALIWRRSLVQERKEQWCKWGASMGDCVWEAVRKNPRAPFDTRIVAYDARFCEVDYDELTGTEIERVVITIPYFDLPEVGPRGVRAGLMPGHEYVRILDREGITVYRDGDLVPGESGPHGLGVVHAVHASWLPYVDPSHGNWTAVGLESTAALVDSLLTQIQAIGGRHANPLLAVVGARLAADSDVFQFGRVIQGIAAGGSVEYVEANLQGVAQLLEAAQVASSNARATLPEFLFSQAGATASGAALNFWAAAFTSKILSIRGRWSSALSRVTEYAVRMDKGDSFDPDDGAFRILAAPPLPVNVTEEVDRLSKAKEDGGILLVDYVRGIQRVGMLGPEVDPEEYAKQLEAQEEAKAARAQKTAAAMFGPAKEEEEEEGSLWDGEPVHEGDAPADEEEGE